MPGLSVGRAFNFYSPLLVSDLLQQLLCFPSKLIVVFIQGWKRANSREMRTGFIVFIPLNKCPSGIQPIHDEIRLDQDRLLEVLDRIVQISPSKAERPPDNSRFFTNLQMGSPKHVECRVV